MKEIETYKRNDVIKDIKHLLNIDISEHIIDKNTKSRSFIFLDTSKISENDLRDIIRVGWEYKKFTLENNGWQKVSINFKKPNFQNFIDINWANHGRSCIKCK